MSAPGKFDYSSGGLDRPLHRSNFAAQMERSSSFRESMEQPVPSHPNMLKSTSPIAQTDVTKFFRCLRFDPKVVAADHKSIRQGDFKQHMNVALGIQADESPSGSLKGTLIPSPIPEEIKRFKTGLRENNVKARERVKIFNEASSVFNKCFPSVPTKKRSRAAVDDSADRLVSGSGLGKMGIQGQTLAGSFELDQQMFDERTKSGVPNKRTRTSMMDIRNNSTVRRTATVDRDKEMMQLANQGEDQTSIGIDSWGKPKMRKKRSGIKMDCHPNMASYKVGDGYRDLKQGIQQKSTGDSRSRLNGGNGDSSMLRQAAGSGATGYGRSDNLSQQTNLAGHSPLPRVDSDQNSFCNEKRERSIGSEKERVNLRAVNKSTIHDEFNSSSLVSNTKTNASVRGPRSGSGLPPKLSPGLHNTLSLSEWDISGCTNKPPKVSGSGVTHRKRITSNRSSSASVTQWASQRQQKKSRIARRTSLVPIVSSKDEVPYSDNIPDAGCGETGFGLHKESPAASPQLKLKGESSFSTATLSESEESGFHVIRSKDKGKQSDEVDGKAAQSFPKVSIPALQSRKNNKFAAGEEIKDGVRRQGRTGSTRSLNPMRVEKFKNIGTAKQLRTARPIFDKSESKVGRPPTRKLSDRKAYKRQRATTISAPTLDFHVGSDDGHEELLAAVNSAVNFAQNYPNSFWKQMDRYFCFISDEHINFVKHQGEPPSMGPTPVLTSSDFDSQDLFPEDLATRVDSNASPLYQRLLSALISEDSMSVNEGLQANGFGAMHDINDYSEFNYLNNMVEFNGFRNNERMELDESEDDGSAVLFRGINKIAQQCNDTFSDYSPINFLDIQYDKLGIDEKIYLEAQSIGIPLQPMPSISNVKDDDGIVDKIKKLEEAICKESSKKREMADRLLKLATEMKELQEKELVQLGYEKLIEMAYEKSKASRRHHSAGVKNSNNKISKQAASASVKRALEQCREFEETGKSCFSQLEIKRMFIARTAVSEDTLPEECSPSISTPMWSQPSSSLAHIAQNLENNVNSSDVAPSLNALVEQTRGKEERAGSNGLDDVGIGTQLSSFKRGKRSDIDGKGQASCNKIGRPSLSNAKDGRKPKAKPKEITSQISSSSVRILEQPKHGLLTKSSEANKEYNNMEETEPILDLSQLQIPDGLGGIDDFGTQGDDISSWFNLDDDEDIDIMELEIPMDDLSGLNIRF